MTLINGIKRPQALLAGTLGIVDKDEVLNSLDVDMLHGVKYNRIYTFIDILHSTTSSTTNQMGCWRYGSVQLLNRRNIKKGKINARESRRHIRKPQRSRF